MKKSSQRKLKVVVSNAQKLLGKYVKYRDSFPNTEKAEYFGQTRLRYLTNLTNKFKVFEMLSFVFDVSSQSNLKVEKKWTNLR